MVDLRRLNTGCGDVHELLRTYGVLPVGQAASLQTLMVAFMLFLS